MSGIKGIMLDSCSVWQEVGDGRFHTQAFTRSIINPHGFHSASPSLTYIHKTPLPISHCGDHTVPSEQIYCSPVEADSYCILFAVLQLRAGVALVFSLSSQALIGSKSVNKMQVPQFQLQL